MIRRLRSFFEDLPAAEREGPWIVACSGGADSVCLALALADAFPESPDRFVMCHVHHGIRGAEADEDAAFVQALAERIRRRFLPVRASVPERQADTGDSLEMAARAVRLEALRAAARDAGARGVLTGHTRDDQAETVLLRLIAGAGSDGLCGMKPVHRMYGLLWGKPLLSTSRQGVEAFLEARGECWREDASNRDTGIPRNFIRHDVLPGIRDRLNPNVAESICRSAASLRDDVESLHELADEACRSRERGRAGRDLDAAGWGLLPSGLRRGILLQWLIRRGLPPRDIRAGLLRQIDEAALRGEGNTCFSLRGADVIVEYGRVRVREASPGYPGPMYDAVPVAEGGWTRGLGDGWALYVAADRPRTPIGRAPGTFPASACLSRTALSAKELRVRTWRPGDRFAPVGSGSRKLQDIWTDCKVPRALRERIPLLLCGETIVWIPGYAVSRDAVLEPGSRSCLYVECRDQGRHSSPLQWGAGSGSL